MLKYLLPCTLLVLGAAALTAAPDAEAAPIGSSCTHASLDVYIGFGFGGRGCRPVRCRPRTTVYYSSYPRYRYPYYSYAPSYPYYSHSYSYPVRYYRPSVYSSYRYRYYPRYRSHRHYSYGHRHGTRRVIGRRR